MVTIKICDLRILRILFKGLVPAFMGKKTKTKSKLTKMGSTQMFTHK